MSFNSSTAFSLFLSFFFSLSMRTFAPFDGSGSSFNLGPIFCLSRNTATTVVVDHNHFWKNVPVIMKLLLRAFVTPFWQGPSRHSMMSWPLSIARIWSDHIGVTRWFEPNLEWHSGALHSVIIQNAKSVFVSFAFLVSCCCFLLFFFISNLGGTSCAAASTLRQTTARFSRPCIHRIPSV